ncbi:hypothetical protein [Spirochaeta dissipatitropha]
MQSPESADLLALYKRLSAEFGPQYWWPVRGRSADVLRDVSAAVISEEDRWEVMAGAVLTQNTNWGNVEMALQALRNAGLTGPESILTIQESELAEYIRSSGYYRQKARKLRILAAACLDKGWLAGGSDASSSSDGPGNSSDTRNHLSRIPGREELLQLWGIGPETADCILLYCYGIPVFVIDAYTKRIISRYFGAEAAPVQNYEEFRNWFETRLTECASCETARQAMLYNEFHALFVKLGSSLCKPKPLCSACVLSDSCSHAQQASNEK